MAATAFIKKHDLNWSDVLEGRAVPNAARTKRRLDASDDDLKAAESRLRQMQAHNVSLERQISRLKAQLEDLRMRTDS